MKKLFALVAMLACITTASAQFTVGGTFAFSTSKLDNGNTDKSGSSFKIIPEIGYQIDDNMTLGVQVGYSHGFASFGSLTVSDFKSLAESTVSMYSDINDEDLKLNSFTISPYLRYKIAEYSNVNIYAEGYLGYTNVKADNAPAAGGAGGGEVTLNAFEIGVRPVVALEVNDNIELLCKLGAVGFISAKEKESDMKLTRFGVNADSYNLMWGLNFKF